MTWRGTDVTPTALLLPCAVLWLAVTKSYNAQVRDHLPQTDSEHALGPTSDGACVCDNGW